MESLLMNIYVGNLSYGTTDQDLETLFSAYGTVDKATIIKDRETGKPRGFGFVEMSSPDEAAKAIEGLHGTQFGGRTLTVNEARERSNNNRGPRRF